MLRRFTLALALTAAAFGAVTYLALESSDVVVLRTFDADGTAHDSRVWLAEDASGARWIEAAEPGKPFYLRLLARPDVIVVQNDTATPMTAVPEPGETGHRRVRGLLRAKYGWRDAWIGLLVDTSASVAVRLEPR
jgi:hypothetical protein